jgi:hypothetical protein
MVQKLFIIIILLVCFKNLANSQDKEIIKGECKLLLKYRENRLESFYWIRNFNTYRLQPDTIKHLVTWKKGIVEIKGTGDYTETSYYSYDNLYRIFSVSIYAYWSNHEVKMYLEKRYNRKNRVAAKCFYYRFENYPYERELSFDCEKSAFFSYIIEDELNNRNTYYEKGSKIKYKKGLQITICDICDDDAMLEYWKFRE